MTILALEFSSSQRSAAVLKLPEGSAPSLPGNDPALTEQCPPFDVAEIIETGAGGTRAFGMIEAVLRAAAVEREQIEVLAVGLGPGSYTGIRVALSIAQGWQLAGGVKLLGISSADCLAAQAQAEGKPGPVSVVIDAQRNEFYLAGYEISPQGWKAVEPLHIIGREELQRRARNGARLIGPDATRGIPEGKDVYPSAGMLARLAAGRSDFVSGDQLEPIYLRETGFVKTGPRGAIKG